MLLLLRILRLLVAVVAVVEMLGVRPVNAFRCRSIGQARAGSIRRVSCRDAIRWRFEHQPLSTRPIIAAESTSNMSSLIDIDRGVKIYLFKFGEGQIASGHLCHEPLWTSYYSTLST